MSSLTNAVIPWRQVLLQDPVVPALKESLPELLKEQSRRFRDLTDFEVSVRRSDELDAWYASSQGQGVLVEVTGQVWDAMAKVAPHSMPAHDARHAMFKVPATAIEYMAAEDVHGWNRVGLLGALLHDYGRWAEERIWGSPQNGAVHARLSYVLAAELLNKYPIPVQIANHVLRAVMEHTTGGTSDAPMPLKLTVSADRDQLFGPEIVLRLAHHIVDASNSTASFYGEKPGVSILDRLTHFLVHRLAGPLTSREEQVDYLWKSTADFLLLAEDADASRKRFERILAGHPACRAIPAFNWEIEWEIAQAYAPCAKGPAVALMALLSAPNVAISSVYKQGALDKLSHLPKENAQRLANALAFADEERWGQDQRQAAALTRIAKDNPSDKFVRELIRRLLTQWGTVA